MRGSRWLVMLMALPALVAGCSSDEPRAPTERRQAASPASQPPMATISRAKRAKLAAFLAKAGPLEGGSVGTEFSLEDVQYTSPTDAAAELWNCRKDLKEVCTTVVLTTDDNWAHAAGLAIPDTLADLVYSTPLGHGAVAIKAEAQILRRKSYPPFVLYPDGKVTPLHITDEPRDLDADSVLLAENDGDFEDGIGLGAAIWAADADAGEIFALPSRPQGLIGFTYAHVPGRDGAVLSVSGYHKDVGDGVWRFAESNDNARTWRTTDVRLPLGGKPIWGYTHDYTHAVGPGHLQAIAMTGEAPDTPRYLWELWLTEDEKAFRRVPLPGTPKDLGEILAPPKDLGGMVFASDGALLLGEATGHQIWRLAPGKTELKPLAGAPRLSEPNQWLTLYNSGGGVIVARTGWRTIACSTDGYRWTKVTPGG